MTPTIRPARPGDILPLAALARRTFCETFVDGFKVPYPPEDLERFLGESYAPEAVAAWLAEPGGRVRVAEAGGRLLAYVQTGPNGLPLPGSGPEDGELKRLYVGREAQGQGLGRALLEAGLADLAGRRILIGVWSGNAKAIGLYEAHGFRRAGAYGFRVGSTIDDELILARDAAAAEAFASPAAST